MAGNKNSGRRKQTKPDKVSREPIARVLADIWDGKFTDCPGDGAVAFINCLAHSTGAIGQTFSLRPWQEAYVRTLLTLRPDGLRQYRKSFFFIARKNGKTELCAALCWYFLIADRERGAEVYSAASTKMQASRIYQAMKAMRNASAYLKAITDYSKTKKRIEVIDGPMEGNVYEALSSDADGALGLNPSAVVFDELLVGDETLFDALATGQGARTQPVFISITTAGPYDPNSLVYREYTYAKDVRDGKIADPTYLPVVYELPRSAEWTDESVWHLANPALGDFRSLEEMRGMCAKAQAMPGKQNAFRMFYLNQFCEASTRWLSADTWAACKAVISRAALRGRRCFVGLDLSEVADMTALVLVFPNGSDVDILPFFFTPQDKLREHSDRYQRPYADWVRDGYLIATPGRTVNYGYIRTLLNELATEFDIHSVTYDPWNSSHIISELESDGFLCLKLGQGVTGLNNPMKLTEKMVTDSTLHQDGNPVMDWHMACVIQTMDANGNVKPDKGKSNKGGKIDGVCALLNALDTFSRNRVEETSFEAFAI